MEKRTNFSIWYFIFAILIIISLQGLFNRPHVENLQYSKFRNLVDQKKVKNLVITKDASTVLGLEEALEGKEVRQLLGKPRIMQISSKGKIIESRL